jgi:ATP adenylyltransferase
MRDITACCLCSQIAGREENDLISQMLAGDTYIRRIPFESESFALVPSLGPLVPGHTLLCPKAHVRSIACLPDEDTAEYTMIKDRVCRTLASVYGVPVHCFEHGSARRGSRVLCTVEHAHLHLVPAAIEIRSILETADQSWQHIDPVLTALRERVGDGEYLYYESPDGQALVAVENEGGFEAQYLRKVFARALGNADNWDWRQNPLPRDVDKTYQALHADFCR